jgi:hypothetical protein
MSDAAKKALVALAALVVVAGCIAVAIAFDSPTSVMILGSVSLLGGALSIYFSTRSTGSRGR